MSALILVGLFLIGYAALLEWRYRYFVFVLIRDAEKHGRDDLVAHLRANRRAHMFLGEGTTLIMGLIGVGILLTVVILSM